MKWAQLPNKGDVPKARSSHSISAVGDKLYCWGGEHAPRVPIGEDMYMYDLHTQSWSHVEAQGTPPALRVAHAAAAIGPRIYVFGGRNGIGEGEGCFDDLHCFDTETSTWSEITPVSDVLPCKRSYHCLAAGGGKLYLFGGCGEKGVGRLNDLWEFDPVKATWRQLPSSDTIKGRGGAGFAVVPGSLFVIAGFAGMEMSDVHRFDLTTETWDCPRCCTAETPEPASTNDSARGACSHDHPVALPARSVCAVAAHGCASCSHSNHIIVFGGEVDPSSEGHAGAGCYSNDVFCLDTTCQHWHHIEAGGERPAPRGWLAATACNAGVVVHGGNSLSNERLGDMFLLEMH